MTINQIIYLLSMVAGMLLYKLAEYLNRKYFLEMFKVIKTKIQTRKNKIKNFKNLEKINDVQKFKFERVGFSKKYILMFYSNNKYVNFNRYNVSYCKINNDYIYKNFKTVKEKLIEMGMKYFDKGTSASDELFVSYNKKNNKLYMQYLESLYTLDSLS